MTALVPNSFLFRFEVPIRYRPAPTIDGDLKEWTDDCRLPALARMDGHETFATLWMSWSEEGIAIACRVEGRSKPFDGKPKQFWKGDNLRLMLDMRDTRDNKRASRYCQQFYFLPAGGGTKGHQPVGGAAKIHRATEHAPLPSDDAVTVASKRSGKTYTIEALVRADALAGFDPDEHRRIGLFTMLEDVELGQQFLTIGDELYWYIDPSTWATGTLTPPA